jgi:predicted ATPase/DNA-binding XRE family transcriptional regulator
VAGDDAGTLATVLRSLRETRGLSQEELAQRAGLSTHAISALERGTRTRPYPHTLRALAGALDLSEADRSRLIAAVPVRARPARAAPDAATARPRDLPVPTTPLLGREEEVRRVGRLLGEHRLVTLSGPGGVGKTRLALAVATAVRDRYADGVTLVELAPLLEPSDVLPAVADALDAAGSGAATGRTVVEDVVARIRGQHLLLVLDNVEHLLEAAPDVAALIEAAPDLTVLATSRAPLRVRGETEVGVDPLALPSASTPLSESPAARLLLDRAGAVSPGWGARATDEEAVAATCARLAGLPLALELAAARARLLDPAALLDRLDTALQDGPRDLPARQRTMRATLDWSHGLLDEDERRLLRLLGVFVGGFTLEDLEGVAGRLDGSAAPVAPLLEALVEHSLVTPVGGSRFRMLEPVLEYARSLLVEAGEWEQATAAHAAHYLVLAEVTGPRYRDGGQVAALARIDLEHANLTAAAERMLAAGDVQGAARMAWALWLYWWLRGHHAHGRRLSETVLARGGMPDDVHARAALAAATQAFAMDDVDAALRWWQEAHRHSVGDPVIDSNSVAGIGLAALARGELVTAQEQFTAALALAAEGGDESEWTWALAHIWLGTVALLLGDPDEAVRRVESGLASARRRHDRLASYIALYNLFQVELARGDHPRARQHLEEGLRLSLETGDQANLAYLLDALAVIEAAEGTVSRVPLLLGAAQAIREAMGSRGYGYYRPDPDAVAAAEDAARQRLGPDRYDDALDAGRAMSSHDAAHLGLGDRRG